MHEPNEIACTLLGMPFDALDERTQQVARHVAARTGIVQSKLPDASGGHLGARAADAVAQFGGSWTFVGLFACTVLGWVVINTALLATQGRNFDPYPYVLLNLFLSTLAAIQAPVILMAHNRQSTKDRMAAERDYEINLKAELEIMLLHRKLDQLIETVQPPQ
jgi:uncharacterized membrane protein